VEAYTCSAESDVSELLLVNRRNDVLLSFKYCVVVISSDRRVENPDVIRGMNAPAKKAVIVVIIRIGVNH
jgi:hypothetical protein